MSDYLSLCLIAKNEAEYLQEWIDYHRLIGVDRFYIYDNGSEISIRETLREEVSKGLVVVIDIQGENQQLYAYDHCLQNYGFSTTWMGFIDADEFIVPKAAQDLRRWLTAFESFGGLGMNWSIFGSNGYLTPPPDGVLRNYTHCTPDRLIDNQNIKTIVRPEFVLAPKSPHHFIYQPGSCCVNEEGFRIDYQYFPHSAEKIRINHYWSRSKTEFEGKRKKWTGLEGWKVDWERFDKYDTLSTVKDRTVQEVIQQVCLKNGIPFDPQCSWTEQIHHAARLMPVSPPAQEIPSELKVDHRRPIVDQIYQIDRELHEARNHKLPSRDLESVLIDAARSFPTYSMYELNLANLMVDQRQPEKVWAALTRAREISSDSYEVLMHLGYFFQKFNQFNDAEIAYRLAMKIDPNGYKTRCSLCEVLLQKGKYEQAYNLLLPVLEIFPYSCKDPVVLQLIRMLCIQLYQSGKVTEAIQLAAIGNEQNPDDLDLLVSLAKMHSDIKQDDKALMFIRKAARLAPNDADIALGLRMIQSKSK